MSAGDRKRELDARPISRAKLAPGVAATRARVARPWNESSLDPRELREESDRKLVDQEVVEEVAITIEEDETLP